MTNKPKAIDIFSGLGGLTVGLKKAGFKVIGAIEIDHLSVETYKANHPRVRVWETDIRNLDSCEVANVLGLRQLSLDLLAGCPPCQGFSSMRTLNGSVEINDPRNDLLFDFERFVRVLRPRSVMMENVPGLADDVRFIAFCKRMRQMGYIGNHHILDAAKYGVPQRRKRLIYLAGLGCSINPADPVTRERTVRRAIGNLPRAGESGDPVHDMPEHHSKRIADVIARIPSNGGSRTDLGSEYQLDCHKRCDGFKDVYGRMKWDDVAPTITSGCFNPSKGRFLHPEENRCITMREAAILQTFPRHYKFPLVSNKSAIAAMIGNALPPEFIRNQALSVLRYLNQTLT